MGQSFPTLKLRGPAARTPLPQSVRERFPQRFPERGTIRVKKFFLRQIAKPPTKSQHAKKPGKTIRFCRVFGHGDDRDRTDNPLLAKQVLSQLSYVPVINKNSENFRIRPVGVPELESGTSSLSATRSNQLSYTPNLQWAWHLKSFILGKDLKLSNGVHFIGKKGSDLAKKRPEFASWCCALGRYD